MAVAFNEIPNDILTPGVFVEIDPTGAVEGAGIRPHKILVIGYRLSSGTVAVETPFQVTTDTGGDAAAGAGSQLATMLRDVRQVNSRTELWGIGINEATGTNAAGSFAITGPATASGTLNFYIGGKRYAVGVSNGDSATVIGDALEAAVTNDPLAQVTAANTTGTVAITYRHDGPEGNDVDLQINFRTSDVTPAGVAVVTTAMASGATSPSVANAILAIAGSQFDTIISGIADATNIGLLETELETRWGPMVNLDGHLFTAFVDDFSTSRAWTLAPARNSIQHTVVTPGLTPTPPWTVAAQVGGIDAYETTQDPARPRTTLGLTGVVAPKEGSRFDQNERNLLLGSGAATTKIDGGGNVIIERLTTTNQLDASAVDDPTWLDLTTKRTVSFLRWDWDTRITRKFPRHKLADDGTRFDPGQFVVTPSTIRSEAIAWFEEKEAQGLVEGLDQFRTDLVVERNTTDFNRLDSILRPDVINKFVVNATRLNFRL